MGTLPDYPITEIDAAEAYLFDKLTGRPELMALVTGVYDEVAPDGSVPPFVVYAFQGNKDAVNESWLRRAIEPLYTVRVIGRTSRFSDLAKATWYIDDTLHRSDGFAGVYRIAQCVREDVYRRVEKLDKVEWRHSGGYYRLYIEVPIVAL
jgi:hypothetical protein